VNAIPTRLNKPWFCLRSEGGKCSAIAKSSFDGQTAMAQAVKITARNILVVEGNSQTKHTADNTHGQQVIFGQYPFEAGQTECR
jgi:hypothetical protein